MVATGKWPVTMLPKTNLVAMKRHRYLPKKGDIFYMQIPAGNYLFGRVIMPDFDSGPMPKASLVYIYDWQSSAPFPEYSNLLPCRLLIEPVWTNRLGWTRGYFQHVENRAIAEQDLLRRHCFFSVARQKYVDESGGTLDQRFEPCGEWSLASYRWMDDRISDALRIPRVPQEDELPNRNRVRRSTY
jgi:hypothetical protein